MWSVLALTGVSVLSTLLPLFLLGLVVGVPVTAVGVVAVPVGLTARATSAVSGRRKVAGVRLGRLASYVERENRYARAVGLSSLVERVDTRSAEQRADDRIERLKDRYVDGEVSDHEFERRTRRVLDDEGVSRDRPSSVDDELAAERR